MTCPNCGLSTANFNCNNHLMQAPGGLLISHARGYQRNDKNVTFLFEEIARLNVLLHEKDKLITTLEGTIDGLNTRMNEKDAEIERLKGLMPPVERGPGFVGQGSWSVFAEKVVGERDFLRNQIDEYIALIEDLRKRGIIDQHNRVLPLEGHHNDCGHGKDGWSYCACEELAQKAEPKAETSPTPDWRQELKKGDEVRFCLDGLVTAVHRADLGGPIGQVAVREDIHNRVFYVGTDQVIKKLGGV